MLYYFFVGWGKVGMKLVSIIAFNADELINACNNDELFFINTPLTLVSNHVSTLLKYYIGLI